MRTEWEGVFYFITEKDSLNFLLRRSKFFKNTLETFNVIASITTILIKSILIYVFNLLHLNLEEIKFKLGETNNKT